MEYRVKARAHQMVATAVSQGKLKRSAVCQDCGDSSTNTLHGHHEDYAKPLDVVWLCVGCHRRRHRVHRSEPSVVIRFHIRKVVDRAVEIEAARLDCTKQQIIEDALRKFLGIPRAA